jgi:hypothetical protein
MVMPKHPIPALARRLTVWRDCPVAYRTAEACDGSTIGVIAATATRAPATFRLFRQRAL